jgi:NADH-quinone oxidoreductase subunit A
LLTWAGEFFFTKKNHISKKQFYECGFKALSDVNLQINLNFFMLCIFLVLYDVEFLLLFPFLFCNSLADFYSLLIVIFFIFLIIVSLYYDLQVNSLNWQI